MTDRDYSQALTALLPPGPAWDRAEGTQGNAVLDAGAARLSQLDALITQLVEEADTRTARWTFDDWLREYGLPDDCLKYLDDLSQAQLRKALLLKVIRSGMTKGFYARLGAIFDISISTGSTRAYRADARADARLYDEKWGHAFVIIVTADVQTKKDYFRADSRADSRLASWGLSFLECLVRQNAPAHAEVLFRYE